MHFTHFVKVFLPSALHRMSVKVGFFCFAVLPQPPGQCLAHSRRSINAYCMSEFSVPFSEFFKNRHDVNIIFKLSAHRNVFSLLGVHPSLAQRRANECRCLLMGLRRSAGPSGLQAVSRGDTDWP